MAEIATLFSAISLQKWFKCPRKSKFDAYEKMHLHGGYGFFQKLELENGVCFGFDLFGW